MGVRQQLDGKSVAVRKESGRSVRRIVRRQGVPDRHDRGVEPQRKAHLRRDMVELSRAVDDFSGVYSRLWVLKVGPNGSAALVPTTLLGDVRRAFKAGGCATSLLHSNATHALSDPRQRGAHHDANKGMKLTKLSAAWLPEWTCRLMPAPARMDAGTASQLIPGVRRLLASWGQRRSAC